jgi:hypothetical protein
MGGRKEDGGFKRTGKYSKRTVTPQFNPLSLQYSGNEGRESG